MSKNKSQLEDAKLKDAILQAILQFGQCDYNDVIRELNKGKFIVHHSMLIIICQRILDEKPYLSLFRLVILDKRTDIYKGGKLEAFLLSGGFTKEVQRQNRKEKIKSFVGWATLILTAVGVLLAVVFHFDK